MTAKKDKMKDTDNLLSDLNPVQLQAVQQTEGPVLILAGAGSGKTRVLTYRVAYLIKKMQVNPGQILAVTFTNKAATEMRDRIFSLCDNGQNSFWIGTFHSICARILRIEGELLGYERNFIIFDRDDQKRFLRGVLSELRFSEKEHTPEKVLSRIGSAKNNFIGPNEFKSEAQDSADEAVAAVYLRYQEMMKQNNAMDFDDLLLNPIYLFDQNPELLLKYQERFHYILVDEYQDTNRTQYLFLKQLAAKYRNLCVVGDDDQSIYRWRGADIDNILTIDRDYPDCKVFHLEQNYRSTKRILDAAHSVVFNNIKRREKKLWTERGEGEKVTVLEVGDEVSEAVILCAK